MRLIAKNSLNFSFVLENDCISPILIPIQTHTGITCSKQSPWTLVHLPRFPLQVAIGSTGSGCQCFFERYRGKIPTYYSLKLVLG